MVSDFQDLIFLKVDRPGPGSISIFDIDRKIAAEFTNVQQNSRGMKAELTLSCPYDETESTYFEKLIVFPQDLKSTIDITRKLKRKNELIDWDAEIAKIYARLLSEYRDYELSIDDLTLPPNSLTVESVIQGLCLPTGLPSCIFSPGGKGKSIIADFLAVIISHGVAALNLIPYKQRILILDWESDPEVHQRYVQAIKSGLEIENQDDVTLLYVRCDRPIFEIENDIRELIKERNVEFIILDSQMAATAGSDKRFSEAQIASLYYNTLNSFGCTTLTVDHVTKESMKTDDAATPYGSVVKYNRARSHYELKSTQEADSNHLELAFIHQKYNLGRKQKPFGISIDFITKDTENGEELRRLVFKNCDIADNPDLERALLDKDRIKNLLLSEGKLSCNEISERIGKDTGKTRAILNKYKDDLFVKIGDLWGVKQLA